MEKNMILMTLLSNPVSDIRVFVFTPFHSLHLKKKNSTKRLAATVPVGRDGFQKDRGIISLCAGVGGRKRVAAWLRSSSACQS